MSALIIIIGILSVILAIATALIVGFSVANAYIYNQVEYSNNVGEGGDGGVGKGLAPTNEEAQDFVILRESCEMTMDLNWYSKEIKNPVIKKNGSSRKLGESSSFF